MTLKRTDNNGRYFFRCGLYGSAKGCGYFIFVDEWEKEQDRIERNLGDSYRGNNFPHVFGRGKIGSGY